MIKQPGDVAALIWGFFELVAFSYFLIAFSRLYWQAWKMPNRWQAIWKVTNIKPRRNHEWPNATPEADLIVRGALMGLVLFSIAFVFVIYVIARR